MKASLLILLLCLVACKHQGGSSAESTREATRPPLETGSPSAPDGPTTSSPSKTWTEEFVDLVNDHRVATGLRPLIHRSEMEAIAQEHSDDMANKTVAFGHDGFSTRCSEARSALGGGNWCGENVAMGQKSAQAVFDAWMNSSGHRANIESSRATHMGFAYAKSSGGTYYWTQLLLEL